jgi:hypothetical protein
MKEYIKELLENAEENGYSLWDWSAENIANDLIAYGYNFEEAQFDTIVMAVKQLQEERA